MRLLMNLNQELFAVKLYEMEQQYSKIQSRIRICGQQDHQTVCDELKKAKNEYHTHTAALEQSVHGSRSPAVAALARVQLEYGQAMEKMSKEMLEKCMNGKVDRQPDDQAEAVTLYAEYAMDYAMQTMQYALIAALSAMDVQLSADEQRKGAD